MQHLVVMVLLLLLLPLCHVSAAYLLLGEREVCLPKAGLLPHGLECCCGAAARLLCLLLLATLHVRQQPVQVQTWCRQQQRTNWSTHGRTTGHLE